MNHTYFHPFNIIIAKDANLMPNHIHSLALSSQPPNQLTNQPPSSINLSYHQPRISPSPTPFNYASAHQMD